MGKHTTITQKHCFLNVNKYNAENEANSLIKIVDREEPVILNALFKDISLSVEWALPRLHKSERKKYALSVNKKTRKKSICNTKC